jgi:hypothetical protein
MVEIDCDEVQNGEKAAFPGKYGGGLTKREWFAGMALQGLLASPGNTLLDKCADHAIFTADAILRQLAESDGAK